MAKINEIPRRRLDEFVTLYEFESTLVDFFVEGRSDRVLFDHVLEGAGENVRVWEVADVEIPAGLVANTEENVGAKGRVVALAAELNRRLDSGREYPVLCIVDADGDHMLASKVEPQRYLAKTDFTCLESYYWDVRIVRKYLRLSLHDSIPVSAEEFMSRVEVAMREIFLMRLAVTSLGLNFSWIDPASCCGDAKKGGTFDASTYLERVLNKNVAHGSRDAIERRIEEVRGSLNSDPRYSIHGHDLCKLISWLIKPYIKDRGLVSEEVISRSLACCVERADLKAHPLFARVLQLAGL
ncbi:hypothetical protein [Streptomyces sp. NPDC004291]